MALGGRLSEQLPPYGLFEREKGVLLVAQLRVTSHRLLSRYLLHTE